MTEPGVPATPVPAPLKRGSLRRYLIAGMLVWLPILATVWVLSFIVEVMDRTLFLLPASLRPTSFGVDIPGLGIIFAFLVLLLTGLLVANLLGRQLVRYWEDVLQRIPLVRTIYGGVKGFAETLLSNSGNSFRRVVMLQYPSKGLWSIGFLTAENLAEVSERLGRPHVCVFVPTTPNPTSGFIMMVPREDVIDLDMSVDAAMKMIVTLGVVVPPSSPPAAAKVSAQAN
jgi:uncharacterized membrane protein